MLIDVELVYQVLLGFGASAYGTLSFCTACYLIDQEYVSNPVDRMFLKTSSCTRGITSLKKWIETFDVE